MGAIANTQSTVENIVRLRRAERRGLADEDIAAVRLNLEQAAGPTVSRAVAARLLGVSQAALARWEASGDLPLVIAPSGRSEVPLMALVKLLVELEDHRREGDGHRHLTAVFKERRSRATDLGDATRLRAPDDEAAHGHWNAEKLSLRYHRAVALRLDESIVQEACDRLSRWLSEGRIHPRVARQWEEVLTSSPEEIARTIAEDSNLMGDLRQSSPFAGVLSEPERRAVLFNGGEPAR